ncbi:hypothetical protein BD779DRAFT_247737 [Infundibulicybe gibba]|nr:hypothetical protein BD779DRAFT_247737 [Infundibulicybe gibba]
MSPANAQVKPDGCQTLATEAEAGAPDSGRQASQTDSMTSGVVDSVTGYSVLGGTSRIPAHSHRRRSACMCLRTRAGDSIFQGAVAMAGFRRGLHIDTGEAPAREDLDSPMAGAASRRENAAWPRGFKDYDMRRQARWPIWADSVRLVRVGRKTGPGCYAGRIGVI